jgi:hypothetical protein
LLDAENGIVLPDDSSSLLELLDFLDRFFDKDVDTLAAVANV